MKTVHRSEMVAHLWANRTQSKGRNGSGTLYFEGDTIYSYGSHFPVARHVERKGQRCVLFTAKGYSNTTAAHKSDVRGAIPAGVRVFTVEQVGCDLSHRANLKMYKTEVEHHLRKVGSARTQAGYYAGRVRLLVEEANAYAEFFGLSSRLEMPHIDFDKLHAEDAERKRKQAEKRRADLAKRFPDWLAGKHVRTGHDEPVWLRLKADGETVETSRGAEFPLDHAKRVLPLIRSGRAYQHTDHAEPVGHFRIDAVDTDGNVRAGCHTVLRSEIERFAATLGL